jgi:hypothetical protein
MQRFDEYCERVGYSLLAEPINAISNLSFIVAAWAAWRLAKRTGTLTTGVKVLIALAGATAIGSMLWHTFANTLSLYLDVIPIVLFITGFLWLYVRNVMGKSVGFAALSLGAFFLSALLVRPIGDAVHGAPSYLPWLARCPGSRPVSRCTNRILPLHATRSRGFIFHSALFSND